MEDKFSAAQGSKLSRIDLIYTPPNDTDRIPLSDQPYNPAKEHFISEFSLEDNRVVASKNGGNAVLLFHTFQEAHKYLSTPINDRNFNMLDTKLNHHLSGLSEFDLNHEIGTGAGYFDFIGSFYQGR